MAATAQGLRRRLVPVLPLLAAVYLAASGAAASQAPTRPADHIILISIDGLKPRDHLPSPARLAETPALEALRARGSWAAGTRTPF